MIEIKSSRKQVYALIGMLLPILIITVALDICEFQAVRIVQDVVHRDGMRLKFNDVVLDVKDNWLVETVFDKDHKRIYAYGIIPHWMFMRNATKEKLLNRLLDSSMIYHIKVINGCEEEYTIIVRDITEKQSKKYKEVIKAIEDGKISRVFKDFENNVITINKISVLIIKYTNGMVNKELIIPDANLSMFYKTNIDNASIEMLANEIINNNNLERKAKGIRAPSTGIAP